MNYEETQLIINKLLTKFVIKIKFIIVDITMWTKAYKSS